MVMFSLMNEYYSLIGDERFQRESMANVFDTKNKVIVMCVSVCVFAWFSSDESWCHIVNSVSFEETHNWEACNTIIICFNDCMIAVIFTPIHIHTRML